jgi:hypothetical protein
MNHWGGLTICVAKVEAPSEALCCQVTIYSFRPSCFMVILHDIPGTPNSFFRGCSVCNFILGVELQWARFSSFHEVELNLFHMVERS